MSAQGIDPQKDTYTANKLCCANCGWGTRYMGGESMEVPKGQTIEQTACPACGCHTLRRESTL